MNAVGEPQHRRHLSGHLGGGVVLRHDRDLQGEVLQHAGELGGQFLALLEITQHPIQQKTLQKHGGRHQGH
jgi:hypothetical protein